jgi:pimeloyl-ACP methyl ester carboxylesterase
MSNPDLLPNVPNELSNYLNVQSLEETQAYWQTRSFDDVRAAMPEPQATKHGGAVVLEPTSSDRDDTYTMVLGLPFQQGWKPSMYIRAEYARQLIAPDSRMVVLPNNTNKEQYYNFSGEDRAKMESGNLGPFFERHLRVLEELGVRGETLLTGYSLGGLTVMGIAAKCPSSFDVRTVNADELPTGGREPKKLQKAFMKSGGWGEQRQAIADAKLPVLSTALNTGRLALDYARFGLSTFDADNKALHAGMARGDFGGLLRQARENLPEATIKLGRIADSQLFLPSAEVDLSGFDVREYTGSAAHMHATGDNVAAHALMILDAEARQ